MRLRRTKEEQSIIDWLNGHPGVYEWEGAPQRVGWRYSLVEEYDITPSCENAPEHTLSEPYTDTGGCIKGEVTHILSVSEEIAGQIQQEKSLRSFPADHPFRFCRWWVPEKSCGADRMFGSPYCADHQPS